nr:hypothetical protein [Orientia tsutsugamushi]
MFDDPKLAKELMGSEYLLIDCKQCQIVK